jgi:hypothetical protein
MQIDGKVSAITDSASHQNGTSRRSAIPSRSAVSRANDRRHRKQQAQDQAVQHRQRQVVQHRTRRGNNRDRLGAAACQIAISANMPKNAARRTVGSWPSANSLNVIIATLPLRPWPDPAGQVEFKYSTD